MVRLSMSRQFTDISVLLEHLEADGRASSGSSSPANPRARVGKRGGAQGAAAPLVKDSKQTSTGRHRSVSPGRGGPRASQATERVSAEDRERVANDPLVQRVKETMDGMLLDIRPVAGTEPSAEVDSEVQNADHDS